jgi:hypothetical protein
MLRSNRSLLNTVIVFSTIAMSQATCRAGDAEKTAGPSSAAVHAPPISRGHEPNTVDLQPDFQRWGLGPCNQGDRDTCSVFVVIGAMEYALAAKQDRGTRLSVEFLNWASNQATKNADDGGFFSDLWKGYERYGICPEAEMPYREWFDPAFQPGQKALERAKGLQHLLQLHWIKEWNPTKGLTTEQLAEVKRTLARRRPVCGGFLWPKKAHWEQGVLQMCPRDKVRDGHSVLLVGYRDDGRQPGGGVFMIRNSSGARRDGLLSYEYVQAYMNDAVWIDQRAPAASQSPDFRIRRQDPDRSDDSSHAKPGPIASAPLLGQGLRIGGGDVAAVDRLFGDPLGILSAPPTGRNRRISSNQQPDWNNANIDMIWLQPGESLEMPLLEGPGVITHMWFTSHAGWANELGALSIRIYWDRRKQPGVETPLGDFFAVGQGKPAVVESVPVQVSPTGALTCYWRMPFAKSARIVIANDNPDRGAGLYWQVDWVKLDRLLPETAYFHAQYRQEYPAVKGRDYLIADLAGRGQYVGTVMSITLAQDGWFGEGDDCFFIDGEKVPSLQGTGSEDYFNDAWGFRPRTSHWFGQPRWQGDHAGDSGVAYRWHVLDPVGFTKSLRLTIEHKGNAENDLDFFYLERPDFLSSVAFWYQTGEPKAFGRLPPWPERHVPWQQRHMVRAFRHVTMTDGPKVEVEAQGLFGARPLLAWPNKTIGARLKAPFAADESGRYAIRLTAMQGPQYGRYGILIDDQDAGSADFRAAEEGELDLPICTRELSKGTHTITFKAIGIPSEGGPPAARPLAIEMLRLLKLPPEAKRDVKADNEAHFVRLGIGRALYAYRLAYGDLPDSLDTLVHAGMMPKRYLKDENGLPLKCWREGEYLVVESPAPDGWKHRWQGLDPRR